MAIPLRNESVISLPHKQFVIMMTLSYRHPLTMIISFHRQLVILITEIITLSMSALISSTLSRISLRMIEGARESSTLMGKGALFPTTFFVLVVDIRAPRLCFR